MKVEAGTPVVQIISYEWRRVHGIAAKAAAENKRDLFLWNNSEGIKKWDRIDRKWLSENDQLRDPVEALDWYLTAKADMILWMEDLHLYFDSQQRNEIIGRLRRCSRVAQGYTLLLSQPIHRLPPELEKEVFILEIPLPDRDILKTVIKHVVSQLQLERRSSPEEEWSAIAEAALGLTELEADHTFREIIIEKKRLTAKEIPLVVETKEQIIKKSGTLEYFHPREAFRDIGGLENLKAWLKSRKAGFEEGALEFGMTSPKGVLLLGVQGCGKSMVAKAIACEWNLPLLKFDLGKVFQSLLGESEANIRRALDVAEAISPSVLWIDEIEKGLSGARSSDSLDAGVSARVFATMLTWMQEKRKPVFVVATANNIEQLPPELLRKGRFDEIFFVDLPGDSGRKDIWKIHLVKRLKDDRFKKGNFDLNILSKETVGYSGAEIEEAINEALYHAYNDGTELKASHLMESVKATYPLSKVMASNIMKLREWAKVRTRLASDERTEDLKPDDKMKSIQLKHEADNPFINQ